MNCYIYIGRTKIDAYVAESDSYEYLPNRHMTFLQHL